jgi:hypothetical protein
MTAFAMAIGRNDGSTKANAIDFDWDTGLVHESGTKWYRVDLAPLYEEENPSLTLYLTNPSNVVGTSVDVHMKATIAGQVEDRDYTIAARQYKSFTANASMLVRMKQTEIFLTLSSNGNIKLSAKVFESSDLDETCKDARELNWNTATTQEPMYSAWWKVDLSPVKNAYRKDAKITITNTGTQTVNLKIGQSLDCPSSGVTKRIYMLAAGESVIDTVPQSMINGVQPDELYFGVENVEAPITMKVELVNQPAQAIIPEAADMPADMHEAELHVTDTIVIPAGKTLYRISVAQMNALAKYEPEFTYRNQEEQTATVAIKMAFERPSYSTSNTDYTLAPGEEQIVVYKKNMLEGLDGVDSIYLLTVTDQPIHFYGRFKHVREGKACKTNIDFNWASGHTQEGRTTQWYAVEIAEARDNLQDIIVHITNQGHDRAKVKASMAFSCPYIDLEEVTRTLAVGDTVSRRIGFSSYSMMTDTVWIGLETDQNLHFWAETQDAKENEEVDTLCLHAKPFNWDEGVMQYAGDTVWYWINMEEARQHSAKFPTIFVQNMSSTKAAKIAVEVSVECPDEIENQKRTLTIEANGSYSKKLAANLFENIVQDEIYVRVVSSQDVALQVILTEKPAGSDCENAITFNWTSGNKQEANANLWYIVNLSEALTNKEDVIFKIENKDNTASEAVWQFAYRCSEEEILSVQKFDIPSRGFKLIEEQYASLKEMPDSVLYVNLQGSTSLHLSATRVPVGEIDTINREGLTIDPIVMNSGAQVVPDTDTAWYVTTFEEIEEIRALSVTDPQTLEINLTNTGSEEVTVTVEIAYAFPITEKMQTLTFIVPAGSEETYTLDWKKFNQRLADHDTIYVRITLPTEAVGTIGYNTRLVPAFDGASRAEAIPIVLGNRYEQDAMTERWYKLNMPDLKRDKNLYDKILNVVSKNVGDATATINMAIYEGLLSNDDLLYGALTDEHSRKIKKGQGQNRNIPAQSVYVLGDAELYIWLRTTEKFYFETKFNGTYAPIAPQDIDTMQFQAKLLVPNVDYMLPADTTMWFMVCAPYMQNNFKYIDSSALEYELMKDTVAHIEMTGTFQDTMTCKMPVRRRTINKNGKERQGHRYLHDIMDSAIKRFDKSLGMPTIPEDEMDSMLHRFLTSDSVTYYIRLHTDQSLRLRLNTPQVTGSKCDGAVEFDREHGNVNPADQKTWYHVHLAEKVTINGKDSLITYIPDSCDMRLHVENWSNDTTEVTADIYFDCNDPKTKGGSYKIAPGEGESIDVDRDFLERLGWADMIIDYQSDQVTHIWAELIKDTPRGQLCKTIRAYVCHGDLYHDTITGEYMGPIFRTMTWTDTVPFQDGVSIKDSLTTFIISPLLQPEPLTADSMRKLGIAPVLVQGMQLFVDSSNAQLLDFYRTHVNDIDTIMHVDTVYWAKPVYNARGILDDTKEEPLDLDKFYTKTDLVDKLLLVIKDTATCNIASRYEVAFTIEPYAEAEKQDTLCPPVDKEIETFTYLITDEVYGRPRYVDTVVTHIVKIAPEPYTMDQLPVKPIVENGKAINATNGINWLMTQFERDAEELTMAVTDVRWQVTINEAWQDLPYTVGAQDTLVVMRYVATTECDSELYSDSLRIVLTPPAPPEPCQPFEDELTVDTCNAYYWELTQETYYTDGDYTFTTQKLDGCDSTITLHLTIGHPSEMHLPLLAKYGDRLLMINRKEINALEEWDLDLDKDTALVKWFYRLTQDVEATYIGTGYYYTKKDGAVLDAGFYHAEINVPATAGDNCGLKGMTDEYEVVGGQLAPALVPTLAQPGEELRVLHLDPEQTYRLRIYTTEGIIQGMYTAYGQETFTIRAAAEHGFYLVEIISESDKSTLRYIVK